MSSWTAVSDPNFCNFLRVSLHYVFTGKHLIPTPDARGKVHPKDGFNELKNIYVNHFDAHLMNYDTISKCSNRFLMKNFIKHSNKEKMEYCDHFSTIRWRDMDDAMKSRHTIICKECPKLKGHGMYPSESNRFSTKRKSDPKYGPKDISKRYKTSTKKVVNESFKQALNVLNSSFSQTFGISFEEQLARSTQFEKKQTPAERRKQKVNIAKEFKDKIENEYRETGFYRIFGLRKSFATHDKERDTNGLEPIPDAIKRTAENKRKIKENLKKPKDHVGPLSSYKIDTDLLEQTALSWSSTFTPDFKSVGQMCVRNKKDEIPANCGQVVHKYLDAKEKNDESFSYTYAGKNTPGKNRVRRERKKLFSYIKKPIDVNSKQGKQSLAEKVSSGEIDIGENVVGRVYQKVKINKSGESCTQSFTVFGRKHTLKTLRKKLFLKQKQFMRLNSDEYFETISDNKLIERLKTIHEYIPTDDTKKMKDKLKAFERSRHLQTWHDGSTICNHGHILFTINVLYDPAIFYTSAEYKEITGLEVNIQSIVEQPEIYIVGRCRANDEQLGYNHTRIECLKDLRNKISLEEFDQQLHNMELSDTMRLFHGDGCAMALESGNQSGGHYFCPSCNIHLHQTDDIPSSYNQKFVSMANKQHKVLRGKYGKINSCTFKKTLPFDKLSRQQIKDELTSRQVDFYGIKDTKADLLPLLKDELAGIKRLPILLMPSPRTDLNQLGLAKYEVSMVECMHDVANHIENILCELPFHLKPNDKEVYNKFFQNYKNQKEQKRCCDWRKILLLITSNTHFQIDGIVHRLLMTLSEIQRILYLDDDHRTAKEILRLHNVAFEHFVLLKRVMKTKKFSANMTRDKMFGKYSHNLMVHAPMQYRLISGKSVNVENEERFFNTIKAITKNTSDKKAGHLIGNLIVRHEAEQLHKTLFEHQNNEDHDVLNEIESLGKNVYKKERNTVFLYEYIRTHGIEWQAHLERIADFLVFGEGVWWTKTAIGIEFFDYVDVPEVHPRVHHFRSSSLPTVSFELEEHWRMLVNCNITIPAYKIFLRDGVETYKEITTPFLLDSEYVDELEQLQYEEPDEMEVDEIDDEPDNEMEINEVVTEVVDDVITNFDVVNVEVDAVSSEKIDEPASCCSKNLIKPYLTKEAHAISIVLGDSVNLRKFDERKNMVKSGKAYPNTKRALKKDHSYFKEEITKTKESLTTDFENWERLFFANNECSAPSETDIQDDPYSMVIVKKLRVANQLIQKWNE